MGRPKKPISEKQVEQLAALGCTNAEIAVVVGCNPDTLYGRFSESIKKGKESLKTSLRRMQFRSAQKGSVAMQIWLGKQYLGQTDKVDLDVKDVRERAELAVKDYMRQTGKSRSEAIEALQPHIPQISLLVH